ncbi:hypothetical protein BC828DRAFT_386147 [Blastocladiella britannica]|nr:hypothetical protein BC828DRAFT_386147 [Blastocladiella britannica]
MHIDDTKWESRDGCGSENPLVLALAAEPDLYPSKRMRNKQLPSLAALPLELLEIIFAHLEHVPLTYDALLDSSPIATFAALAGTCRDLHAAALPYLYRCPAVETSSQRNALMRTLSRSPKVTRHCAGLDFGHLALNARNLSLAEARAMTPALLTPWRRTILEGEDDEPCRPMAVFVVRFSASLYRAFLPLLRPLSASQLRLTRLVLVGIKAADVDLVMLLHKAAWSLAVLSVAWNPDLTDRTLEYLAHVGAPDLRALDLSHCTKLTDAALAATAAAAPDCRVLGIAGLPKITLNGLLAAICLPASHWGTSVHTLSVSLSPRLHNERVVARAWEATLAGHEPTLAIARGYAMLNVPIPSLSSRPLVFENMLQL